MASTCLDGRPAGGKPPPLEIPNRRTLLTAIVDASFALSEARRFDDVRAVAWVIRAYAGELLIREDMPRPFRCPATGQVVDD
jgi:hypothetical protein